MISGHIFVGLAVVGIALPLLPTTPFLLLAVTCYMKSSDRFYFWLINNKWLGKYINNYRQGKGVPLKVKVISIALLWTSVILSTAFTHFLMIIKIILIIIAVGVTIHISLIGVKTEKNR